MKMNKEYTKTSFFNKYFKDLLENEGINYQEEYKIKNTDIKELLKEYSYSKTELNVNRYFDFYLPDYNLFIELNTLFTHCLPKFETIHNIKQDLAKELNKEILFIWDIQIKDYQLQDNEICLYSKYMSKKFEKGLEQIVKTIKEDKNKLYLLNKEFVKNNYFYNGTIKELRKQYKEKYKPTTLEEAKDKWPEWYQERIIEGKPRKYVKKDLYNWWLRKCKDGTEIKVGHRYYCALALVSFATKCNVPYDEVKADLYSCLDLFDSMTIEEENHFTKDDIEDALKIYGSDKAHRFKREYISKQTSIEIKENKRNGLTRTEHLTYLKELNSIKRKMGLIKRPNKYNSTKREKILNYLKENPSASNKQQIAKELTLSYPTVLKWYDSCKEELKERNFYNKGTENFNLKEWKIYNYLKDKKDNKTNKKTNLSKELNMDYRTLVKYYDKIKEIVDQELAFESIFNEEDN
jgi:predicted DNA-binding protein (UPF0278 family)